MVAQVAADAPGALPFDFSRLFSRMSVQPRKVLAVMTDLFFSAKIHDMAKKVGMSVEFVKDKPTVLEKLKEKPSLVIFDLNCDAAEPISTIRAIKSDPETKRVSTIGFVSHVQTDLKMEAQESGCDMVVARSVFAQNLPLIFKRHAIAPPAR
jgi:CheY-like chemotaxis protein